MRGKTKRKLNREVNAGLAKLGQFSKYKAARKLQTQNRLEVSRTWKGERRKCTVCGEEYSCELFGVVLISTFRGEDKVSGSICFGCLPEEIVKTRLHVKDVPKLHDVLGMIESTEKDWSERNKKA